MMNKIQVNNLSNILFAQFFSQLEQLKKKTMTFNHFTIN